MKRIVILFKDVTRPTEPLQEIVRAGKYSVDYVEKYINAKYYVAIVEGTKILRALPFYDPTKENLITAQKILARNKKYYSQLSKMIDFMGVEVK